MRSVWIVYIKSSEIELVYSYLEEWEAKEQAKPWNKYAKIYELKIPNQ